MVLLLQGDALLVTLAKNLSPSQRGKIISVGAFFISMHMRPKGQLISE